MNKNTFLSALLASTTLAGAAAADTTLTSSLNMFTFETGGTTYSGAIASTLEAEFDLSQNLYANASFAYVTSGGTDAVGFGAGLGYWILNDLNAQSGLGSQLGVGLYLGGMVELTSATAITPNLIADASVATPISDFGGLWSYDVGVEYAPLGLYVNYMNASFTDVDLTLEGFGIGYRSRF